MYGYKRTLSKKEPEYYSRKLEYVWDRKAPIIWASRELTPKSDIKWVSRELNYIWPKKKKWKRILNNRLNLDSLPY